MSYGWSNENNASLFNFITFNFITFNYIVYLREMVKLRPGETIPDEYGR